MSLLTQLHRTLSPLLLGSIPQRAQAAASDVAAAVNAIAVAIVAARAVTATNNSSKNRSMTHDPVILAGRINKVV